MANGDWRLRREQTMDMNKQTQSAATERVRGTWRPGLLATAGALFLWAMPAQAQMLQAPGKASQTGGWATVPPTGQGATSATSSTSGESPHALALRARWVTVPGWSLGTFLATSTQLNDGWGLGLEYLYRRTGFDVVVSLDYSWLNAAAGNFLGKGNDPRTENHYVVFDKLGAISADVSLIGHWNVASWMEIRFGAGLGLGVALGNIYQITNNSDCTLENASDPSRCYPKPVGPIPELTDVKRDELIGKACEPDLRDSTKDTPQSPCYRRVESYPMNVRVVPVLNTLLGVRMKAHKNVYFHVETGWRLVGFYFGGGPEFRF